MRKKVLILIVVFAAVLVSNANGQKVTRGQWYLRPTVEVPNNALYGLIGALSGMLGEAGLTCAFTDVDSYQVQALFYKAIVCRRVNTPFGDVRNEPWWDWKPRNIAAGLHWGYRPMVSPIGFDLAFGYERQNWRLKMPGADDYTNYSKQMLTPEVSLRFSFGSMESSRRFCFEPGMRYNLALSAKGDYNDKEYVNNGVTGLFGIGYYKSIGDGSGTWLIVRYEHDFFDFFNEDFTAPDGTKPYKGFSTNNCAIMITLKQTIMTKK